jgi:hypothetical protein
MINEMFMLQNARSPMYTLQQATADDLGRSI